MFLPRPRMKLSIVGSLRDQEVAGSASDRQRSNFESCFWRTVSSHSSHYLQEVLLAQFSLYVHKGGLKPGSFFSWDSEINEITLPKKKQDSKFEPWRSGTERATSRSLKLPVIFNLYEWTGKKHFVSLKLEGQCGVRNRDIRLSTQAALIIAPGPTPPRASDSRKPKGVRKWIAKSCAPTASQIYM